MSAKGKRLSRVQIRNVGRQTLGFELPALPDQEFRIAIPELISDANDAILPWGFPSPQFDIQEDRALLSIEVPGKIRLKAEVSFGDQQIEAQVTATNLSDVAWVGLNAFTCFACCKAPRFHDPSCVNTYFPVEEKWRALSELSVDYKPGRGRFTFFPVVGGPRLDELWVCRQLGGHYPGSASLPGACIVPNKGGWVAGMTTQKAAYLFNNRELSCLHANPLMGAVPPGVTSQGASTVHILRGTVADFADKCRG